MHRQRRPPRPATVKPDREGKAMNASVSKSQRFLALCMLGLLLFNYPILALFNVTGTVFGVPLLYAYIFIAWAALIAMMAYVAAHDG